MTLFEHVLLQARAGLAEIHRDRARALDFMARYGGSPGLDAWLETLAVEQQQHAVLIEGIAELRRQNHPALLHQVRATRMAKAALRPVRADVCTGTDGR